MSNPQPPFDDNSLLGYLILEALNAAAMDEEDGPPEAADPDDPVIGRRLGDFTPLRRLGRGGMGVVYLARQHSLRRRVALKVLSRHDSTEVAVTRFLNEARWASRLDHRNVVQVYSAGKKADWLYYAMPRIQGKSLDEVIQGWRAGIGLPSGGDVPTLPSAPAGSSASVPGLTPAQQLAGDPQFFRFVVILGLQAAMGLAHAHERGLIHRDIKPGNLMVDKSGHLWVIDFGIARLRDAVSEHTPSGVLIGALPYMSPEQVSEGRLPVDHHTDIYSLGVTLYELLTLERPFTAENRVELPRKIREEEPRPLRELQPAVPPDLETIVSRAMAKDAAARYRSAAELADDLRRFLNGEPIKATPLTLDERIPALVRKQRSVVEQAIAMIEEWSALQPGLTEFQRQFLQMALQYYASLCQGENSEPEERARVADAHRRVGDLLRKLGRLDEAEPDYCEAVRLAGELVEEFPGDPSHALVLAQAQLAHGVQLSDTGQPDGAERAFLQAMALAERWRPGQKAVSEEGNWPAVHITACLNLGGLYHYAGRFTDAELLYRKGIDLSAKCREACPGAASYLVWLAQSHYSLGLLLETVERPDEAYRLYEETLRLVEEMANSTPAGSWGIKFAESLDYIETLVPEDRLGRPEAERLYHQGITVIERLVAKFPGIPDCRKLLAIRLDALGNLFRRTGRPADAESSYRRAVEVCAALIEDYPDIPEYWQSKAFSLTRLGKQLYELGRLDEAKEPYREVLRLRQALVDRSPAVPKYRENLAEDHRRLGSLLQSQGRSDEAEGHFQQATLLEESLTRDFPAYPATTTQQA